MYSYDYSYSYDVAQLPMGYWFFVLAISILMIVCYWKIFEKAGEKGWISLIPFYNTYIIFKIAFGNGWMFLLMLVPVVNFVFAIMLPFKMAKAFGKETGYGVGLWLLPFIFYPMLAFGKDTYVGVKK